ncbi:MAG: MoxR family ATPase [Proteobacteria bacterium]|nr:MoxR family ATPase [Pseudomonadota bacterium]
MSDVQLCGNIIDNINKVIVGKNHSIELLLVALIAEGHALIEDVPGLGKTLLAKSLARSIGGSYKRVQFTPDLLPSDITGFNIFDQKKGEFTFQKGPVITNILLADEINRTIPRTQSSLLESMEEHQVTIDGHTILLPAPFFVIATQNPIELEGTFPLPEAQLDRFLVKINLGYPKKNEEMKILERFQKENPLENLKSVATPLHITELQHLRKNIYISSPIREYITNIVRATRDHPSVRFGVSPRGAIGLMRSAQAIALIRGRDYVLPDDIQYLSPPVLSHRLILSTEERLRGTQAEDVLDGILSNMPVPATME